MLLQHHKSNFYDTVRCSPLLSLLNVFAEGSVLVCNGLLSPAHSGRAWLLWWHKNKPLTFHIRVIKASSVSVFVWLRDCGVGSETNHQLSWVHSVSSTSKMMHKISLKQEAKQWNYGIVREFVRQSRSINILVSLFNHKKTKLYFYDSYLLKIYWGEASAFIMKSVHHPLCLVSHVHAFTNRNIWDLHCAAN